MVVEKKEIRKVNVASKTQRIVFMMFALDVLVPLSSTAQVKRWGIGSCRAVLNRRPPSDVKLLALQRSAPETKAPPS